MPKDAVAEWLLSLFTAPDKAAAIVGDLSEQGRGTWPNYLCMAASLVVRSAALRPVRLLLSIPLGWSVFFGVGYYLDRITSSGGLWTTILASIVAGLVIGLFDRGQELPACLAMAVTLLAFFLYVAIAFPLLYILGPATFVWSAIHPPFLIVSTGMLMRKLRPVH
jgi:hypothetical protein